MSLLCVVASCRPYVGVHTDNCGDDRCRGCLPKLAVDDLQVCAACRTRIYGRLSELPGLYNDLLTPTATRGGGGRGDDQGDDGPATLAVVPIRARAAATECVKSFIPAW